MKKTLSTLHSPLSTPLRVGVFDSGLGGLTVVRALMKHLPWIDIVYVADTANAPYGEKSHEQIRSFSEDITNYLIQNHDISALVIACNTATSAAISYLRDLYPDLPIVGTEPGIKPGTDVELFERACPGLVEQIESGKANDPLTRGMLEEWLKPMREAGVDTIVLGCTHYPLVADIISNIMDTDVTLIETGEAIARRLKEVLDINSRQNIQRDLKIYATGYIDHEAVKRIVEEDIRVEKLEILL